MPFNLPQYDKLNNTQKLIIEIIKRTMRIRENSEKPVSKFVRKKKLAIIGGPGTGKSIIVIHAAKLLAHSNKKCLVLSYGRLLSYQINCVSKNNDLNLTVTTYHSWFYKTLIELGFKPEDLQEKDYFYDIDKVEDALNNESIYKKIFEKKLKYDFIFVDEAQDVQDGLIKIFSMFCDNLIVTFDDCQKIGDLNGKDSLESYDHSNILIDLNICNKFIDFIDNYRNTKQIETIGRLVMSSYDTNDKSLYKITSKNIGNKPKLIRSSEKILVSVFAKYVVDHYDKSKSVAVLFHKSENKLFENLKNAITSEIENQKLKIHLLYKYGNDDEKCNIDVDNSLNDSIFLMTFDASKGLEFDEVYVITAGIKINNYKIRNALYVAITRAKSMLYVVLSGDKSSKINKLFLDNKYLFEEEII